MSNGSELKSPAAQALRRHGFKPLPRYWVPPEDFARIVRICEAHTQTVNAIREAARAEAFVKGGNA